MNILLVGALSWNPERFLALCERGHKLYGLWTRTMAWEQGPYKFAQGYITDVTLANYANMIRREKIDIIYSLFHVFDPILWTRIKDSSVVDIWTCLRRIVADRDRGLFDIPIVRHWGYDVHNLDRGLMGIFDGQIFCNREKYVSWITSRRDGGLGIDIPCDAESLMFMDSDLPKGEFLTDNFSPKLSDMDGQIHTVCIGRPLEINYVEAAERGIHVHIYCNNYDDIIQIIAKRLSYKNLRKLIGSYIHIYPSLQTTVDLSLNEIRRQKSKWVSEFSQYDAGWSYVHIKKGDFIGGKASIPNRLSTYILCGLPVISEKLPGHYRYDILDKHGIQITFKNYDDLYDKLKDKDQLRYISSRVKECRTQFTFDYHINDLIRYFENIIKRYHSYLITKKTQLNSDPIFLNVLNKYAWTAKRCLDRIRRTISFPKRKYVMHLIFRSMKKG